MKLSNLLTYTETARKVAVNDEVSVKAYIDGNYTDIEVKLLSFTDIDGTDLVLVITPKDA